MSCVVADACVEVFDLLYDGSESVTLFLGIVLSGEGGRKLLGFQD